VILNVHVRLEAVLRHNGDHTAHTGH